jgi:hypothetical protein
MKNSIPLWMEFLGIGHGAWGIGHGEEVTYAQCPMPNAQCPKRRGDYPSPPIQAN